MADNESIEIVYRPATPETDRQSRLRYAHAKFDQAVHLLAVGEGNVKSRLVDALIHLSPVFMDDLPEELRGEWESVRVDLTSKPATQRAVVDGEIHEGVEGRLDATLRTMRRKRAVEIAERICEFGST